MMAVQERIGITGVGYAVPQTVRLNDDPIFDWLRQHATPGKDLFQGYRERRVLAPGETLIDLMLPAAEAALRNAQLAPEQVDLLLGYGSVSESLTPNILAEVHAKLALPERAWIVPVNNEFNNFNTSLVLAHSLIETGHGRNALIVCGCNWTRHVDYHTPQSVSASDGAGAAVIGRTSDPSRFALIDAEATVRSGYYGDMYLRGDPVPRSEPPSGDDAEPCYTKPFFHITADGQTAFTEFGAREPPHLARRLLERHGLPGAGITLITHQASSVLNDAWNREIQPAQYLETLEAFANMTLANIPVSLAFHYGSIEKDTLLLLGVGVEMQASALLLKRN
jgi:3-oxoacyl-[acyl-carrier-protein] synthase III